MKNNETDFKKLTIKGTFNDYFTGYKDKESSVSMTVDLKKDCTCMAHKKCWIHRDPEKYILTDIE
jgi:hypothetical protein